MAEKPAIPKRISALFSLSRMSPTLKSDVLADEIVAKRWDIAVARTANLGKGRQIPSEKLFLNLQRAADGVPLEPWVDAKGRTFSATATMQPDGAAIVRLDDEALRFEHVSVMSSDPARRLAELAKAESFSWLGTSERGRLQKLVGEIDFTADRFFEFARIMSSSPFEFLQRLQAKVRTRQVAIGDFFPDDSLYWDHLAAAWKQSPDLKTFIAHQLAEERTARLVIDPRSALESISPTFCAPGLVPDDLFGTLDAPQKLALLEDALQFEDPFSRIGALEICAKWLPSDPAFIVPGERLLDSLFADKAQLENQCALFGMAYILAVARLAEDQDFKECPAYWRRLVAASHAGLAVRAFAGSGADGAELFKWAMMHRGSTYFLSILSDFPTCPRWRPEWIEPRFVVADIAGRAMAAVTNAGDAPPTWTERIEALRSWLEEKHIGLLTMLPAVLEGDLPRDPPVLENLGGLNEPFKKLMNEKSLDTLLQLTPAIWAFGFPAEARPSLDGVISIIRRNAPPIEEELVLAGVKLISHIAVTTKDRKLADSVVEALMERVPIIQSRPSTLEAAYRFVECRGADTDAANATTALARRLEQFAFLVPSESSLPEVVNLLETIKMIDPSLECRLGRAMAIAKLGSSKPRPVKLIGG
jgi:hypothetical protein